MKKTLLFAAVPALLLAACKKNYTCACGNMNSSERTPVFEVKDTKKNAEQKCEDYRKNQVAIPEWTCEIQ